MENNRKYFIVPLEYAEELDLFTNEQLGELFRAFQPDNSRDFRFKK